MSDLVACIIMSALESRGMASELTSLLPSILFYLLHLPDFLSYQAQCSFSFNQWPCSIKLQYDFFWCFWRIYKLTSEFLCRRAHIMYLEMIVKKDLPQIPLTRISRVCFLLSLLRVHGSAKALSHWFRSYGFFQVCVLLYIWREPCCAKALPHR